MSKITKSFLISINSIQIHTQCERYSTMKLLALILSLVASAYCCDVGWIDAGGIYCYHIGTSVVTWGQAQEVNILIPIKNMILFLSQYCWNFGARLAEFADQDEEMKIDEFLPGDVFFWIGLTDRGVEGIFRWEESHLEANYTNWADTQPDDAGGDEDCVVKMFTAEVDGRWNDAPCSSNDMGEYHYHALCQKPR